MGRRDRGRTRARDGLAGGVSGVGHIVVERDKRLHSPFSARRAENGDALGGD
jgi:hypothetical protein